MRILIWLTLSAMILSPVITTAQADTLFFDRNWKPATDKDSVVYYRTTPEIKGGRYEVKDYFLNGALQMLGHYTTEARNLMEGDNIADKYRDGKFEYYFENGKTQNEGLCENGAKVGIWTYYYGNGAVKSTSSYKTGKLHGRYIEYDSLTGLPCYLGDYINNYAEGIWTFYFIGTDKLKSKLTFKKDRAEGIAIYYDSLSGKPVLSGTLKNGIRQGKWNIYERLTGELIGEENYKNGKRHGERFYLWPGTKQKWVQTTFSEDLIHGELITHYESGKLKRKAFFSSGEMISCECYDENGNTVECFPFYVAAQFDGDLMTYIGNNLRYPEQAKKNRLEGKVMVTFIISRGGMVQNPVVTSGFDADCDAEALRLVSQMPPWQPEYVDGVSVESVKTVPIVFWLPE